MKMDKSARYFIKLDYNGASFHGWQIQPNATTVQELVNLALSKILRDDINVVGAGRTDTGVHAKNFIAHFNSAKVDGDNLAHLCFKLNRFLPKSINIQSISPVEHDAHARFDATARTYRYYATYKKDVFNHPYSIHIHRPLDIEKMNNAANVLFNYSDFTSFSKVDTDTKTNNCKIMHAVWQCIDNELVFTIKADRFLRNMVRAIVGTLLEVGQNKISINEFCKIVELKDRGKAGSSAPGNALFLEQIDYPYPV